MLQAIFHESAQWELADAALYYEHEQPGKSQAFLSAVRRCECRIIQFPEAGLRIEGEVRRWLVNRFPYTLLYRITPNGNIRIIAVMHQKRHPFYWLGRE